MTRQLILIASALLIGASGALAPTAMAKGSAADGANKAGTCLACHGVNGNSVANPEWPSLAGQNANYVYDQLKLWHSNGRVDSSNLMPLMAAPLNDQDMQDLAAYYAAQTPTGLEADPSYWEAGQKLYRGGDKSRNIPACMACHGPVGRGNPAAGYPALRAQHSVYTVKQLTDYAGATRYIKDAKGNSAGGAKSEIMHTIAGRLTQEDIRNVASYIQGMR